MQCSQTKPDGERCRGTALASGLCFAHDPAHAEKLAAARKRGGVTRSRPAAVLPATTADVRPKTVSDVVALLGETISQIRRGELDPKIGNAVGFLAATLLRAVESAELESLAKEVAQLRELVGKGNHGPPGIAGRNQEAESRGGQRTGVLLLEHSHAP